MHSGKLINELFALVETIQNSAKLSRTQNADSRLSRADLQADLFCSRETSESEKFPQSLGLSPADRYLGLLFIVHSQLVRALEPGNDFADAVNIHQVGAVGPPKKIRV
jgi:hypothetical protein